MKANAQLPYWVLPLSELRRRYTKLLEERDTNGWTPTALGEAIGFSDPASDVHGKARRGKWIGRGEQVRMSQVLYLIESGQLTPVKKLINVGVGVGLGVTAMRTTPPAPAKPPLRLQPKVNRRGAHLDLVRHKPPSEEELYAYHPQRSR